MPDADTHEARRVTVHACCKDSIAGACACEKVVERRREQYGYRRCNKAIESDVNRANVEAVTSIRCIDGTQITFALAHLWRDSKSGVSPRYRDELAK